MFTENPFLLSNSNTNNNQSNDLAKVKAHHCQKFDVTSQEGEEYDNSVITIPEELVNNNLVVQVTGGDMTQVLRYFPSKMRIYILENIGEIKVKNDNKPLSKVYVKCFARKSISSSPVFYKDGYTDLRGTFDYASLLIEKQTNYYEFALMVYSEEFGGLI